MNTFVRFSIPKITTYLNKDGKEKKKIKGLPMAWEKINADTYRNYLNQEHKGMCVLTGEINNITVVDFDDAEAYEKMVTEHPELKEVKTIKTKRGFHLYFKYNPNVKTTTNGMVNFNGVDFANDGHMVFAPPTSYVDLNGETIYYADLGGEMNKEIPEYILNDMKQNQKPKAKKTLIIVEEDKNVVVEPETEVPQMKTNPNHFSEIKFYAENGGFKSRCQTGTHPLWVALGGLLLSAFEPTDAEKLWEIINLRDGSADKKQEYKDHFKHLRKNGEDQDKAFNILKKYAKGEIPELPKMYKKEEKNKPVLLENEFEEGTLDYFIEQSIYGGADFTLAKVFQAKWGDKFKYLGAEDKRFYSFDEKTALWTYKNGNSNIRLILSTEMIKLYNNKTDELRMALDNTGDEKEVEIIERKLKKIQELVIKLEKTNDKNNITREITDLIIDTNFEDNMNKQLFVLPLRNKNVIDMRTCVVSERTMEHKFNYECDAEFIEMNEEQEAFAKKYFDELFCNDEPLIQCVLDIIKSSFAGKLLRNIFFHTGVGMNGKSLFFTVLSSLFTNAMDIISKDVILEKKSNSHLNTEMEKLDKSRFCYITELEEKDKINSGNVKAISGGDKINLRTICKTDRTVIPTSTLHGLTNEMPVVKVEKAIMDRLVIIPYENVFEPNEDYKDSVLSKKDLIFTYILKYGVIRDKFELTEKMIASKNDYKDDNEADDLGDFISSNFDKVEGKRILRDEFIQRYNEYLKINHRPANKYTVKKFTRHLREKYGIDKQDSNGIVYYIDLENKMPEIKCLKLPNPTDSKFPLPNPTDSIML